MRRDDLPIREPCGADWEAMEGDDLRRFCRQCDKHVHNLSGMTARQAALLLDRRRGQSLCVQYASDAEGRVQFRQPRARRRLPMLAGMGASLLAACAADARGYVPEATDAAPNDAALLADAGYLDGEEPAVVTGSTRPGKYPCHPGRGSDRPSTPLGTIGACPSVTSSAARELPGAPGPSTTVATHTRGLLARPVQVKGKLRPPAKAPVEMLMGDVLIVE